MIQFLRKFLCGGLVIGVVAIAPLVGIVLCVLVVLSSRILQQRKRKRQLTLHRDLVDLLEYAASALAAGTSLTQAFSGPDIPIRWQGAATEAVRQVGASRRVTRTPWVRVAPIGGAVADAFDVLHAVGAASTGVLVSLAGSIRQMIEVEEELVTAVSQAELSAVVVSLLPLGFLLFLAASGTSMLEQFLSHSGANVICVAGVAGVLLAWAWMQRLIAGASNA